MSKKAVNLDVKFTDQSELDLTGFLHNPVGIEKGKNDHDMLSESSFKSQFSCLTGVTGRTG